MTTAAESEHLIGRSVFARVLVGVEGSTGALEAARQAALLRSTESGLALLAAWEASPPRVAGFGTPAYSRADEARGRARDALDAALETLDPEAPRTAVERGSPWKVLIAEIERRHHTLVAVGPHAGGRMSGIVVGSTATELLHKSPCSVLVARSAGASFPSGIVVGVDGSPQSHVALAAARYLGERFATEVRTVSAPEGTSAVGELLRAAAAADLLVVGSRGLHGPRALGSVSERVAHEAHCSVLVVRYRN